ncbi:hypothetical protein [Zhongshania aquimaris]|uniref:Uncharacterized protein n=1 Tax=Zhongshania aquimaris TaxID=2857107 RepID=A0ABS6VP59_9GAMM|nr:hypothetical protein [Zhongshania aquimaris]MBW2940041.1 hypothetical protein [Zhongshania aquimaris]
MILCRIVMAFGLLNGLFLATALFVPLTFKSHIYGWQQASSLMILHAFVTAAMLYAAVEKQRGSALGLKALPASIMSYILWLCMVLRWLAF